MTHVSAYLFGVGLLGFDCGGGGRFVFMALVGGFEFACALGSLFCDCSGYGWFRLWLVWIVVAYLDFFAIGVLLLCEVWLSVV